MAKQSVSGATDTRLESQYWLCQEMSFLSWVVVVVSLLLFSLDTSVLAWKSIEKIPSREPLLGPFTLYNFSLKHRGKVNQKSCGKFVVTSIYDIIERGVRNSNVKSLASTTLGSVVNVRMSLSHSRISLFALALAWFAINTQKALV